jgi:hypothetical protein
MPAPEMVYLHGLQLKSEKVIDGGNLQVRCPVQLLGTAQLVGPGSHPSRRTKKMPGSGLQCGGLTAGTIPWKGTYPAAGVLPRRASCGQTAEAVGANSPGGAARRNWQ